MLTSLQRRLLDVIGRLPEAAGFALTGGAALIVRGTVDRRTNDLDFFIGRADADAGTIATMVAAVERALGEAGIGSQREIVSDTFARLTVVTEHEECRIDLAVDVRAAARDYQDVAALRRHFSWTVRFELAREKDSGFNLERLLEAVAAFDRLEAEEFDTSHPGYGRLRAEVAAWPSEIRDQR